MLCTQKKDATRAPLVTGATRCRLVAGYRTIWPAGSFTECTPYVSSTYSRLRHTRQGLTGRVSPKRLFLLFGLCCVRTNRGVHMRAKVTTAGVPIEHRREHAQRQRCRYKGEATAPAPPTPSLPTSLRPDVPRAAAGSPSRSEPASPL